MPDPSLLGPGAVTIPPRELRHAEILDDATADGEEVRCVVPSRSTLLAEDPAPWMPYVRATGLFFPKKGDRALLAYPPDGPPVIVAWWPQADSPDVAF
jgi:hypothetical protein